MNRRRREDQLHIWCCTHQSWKSWSHRPTYLLYTAYPCSNFYMYAAYSINRLYMRAAGPMNRELVELWSLPRWPAFGGWGDLRLHRIIIVLILLLSSRIIRTPIIIIILYIIIIQSPYRTYIVLYAHMAYFIFLYFYT